METQSIRKTFKYKLKPPPEQERLLERTLMLCRHVYNATVGERREAWQKCGVSVGYYQQKAELPGIKEAMPEYSEVNSQVLQDVVSRVERAFQAFFRRIREGQTPGYPRFQGRDRYNSFTYPQVGEHGGAGRRSSQPLQDWSHPYSLAPSIEGVTEDRYHQQRGRRLVCLYFLCGCAGTALARDGTGDRHRPRH
jgi:transposase